MGSRKTGNPILPGGIERYGRYVQSKRTYRWKRRHTQVKPKKVQKPKTKEVPIGGDKNGGKRVVPAHRSPRYVSVDKPARPIGYKVKRTPKPTKIRDSITPGTVLILVAGPYKSRRVVCLKALDSGLLLITGPFYINGVPLRRVNQAYVIATSTKLDISNVKVPEEVNDSFFKRKPLPKGTKQDFFEKKKTQDGRKAKKLPESRVKTQKEVDAQVLKVVKTTPLMKRYLGSKFSLEKGVYPHAIKF